VESKLALAESGNVNLPGPLERLARDKHSSLLRKFVNYYRKKFYSTGPRCFQASLIFEAEAITHRKNKVLD